MVRRCQSVVSHDPAVSRPPIWAIGGPASWPRRSGRRFSTGGDAFGDAVVAFVAASAKPLGFDLIEATARARW